MSRSDSTSEKDYDSNEKHFPDTMFLFGCEKNLHRTRGAMHTAKMCTIALRELSSERGHGKSAAGVRPKSSLRINANAFSKDQNTIRMMCE